MRKSEEKGPNFEALMARFCKFFGGPIFGGISENTVGRFEQFNIS